MFQDPKLHYPYTYPKSLGYIIFRTAKKKHEFSNNDDDDDDYDK